jgi:hypothetical protein
MAVQVLEPEVAPEVEALTDDTRRELVNLRESGMTLAELKVRFPQLTREQIRSCLPAGNARERKQRDKATVTEVKQGLGGKSGDTQSKPKGKQVTEQPKEQKQPQPRYAEGVGDLADAVLATRRRVGRTVLAEFMGASQSQVWRWENSRVHPGEVDTVKAQVARFGELPQPEAKSPKTPAPTKAELTHRIETVVELLRSAGSDKAITKAALIDSALAVLTPTDAPKA